MMSKYESAVRPGCGDDIRPKDLDAASHTARACGIARNGSTSRGRIRLGAMCAALAFAAAPVLSFEGDTPKPARTADVVYVATPHDVVDRMLSLAKVNSNDLVYDLGCGDGRVVATAARAHGCRGVGFDINPERVTESRQTVQKYNVADRVAIQQQDIFELDLSPASVITLYLLPRLNVRLIPQLEQLKPGSRIVSHDFDMKGVEPDRVVEMVSKEDGVEHTIYLWTTPLKQQ